MQISNPDAVKSLQEDAKAEDRKRLTALQEAFKEDPNFAMQAFTDGLSVDAAKAKRYDAIAPKVADLEKQVTDLKAQVEGNKVNVTIKENTGSKDLTAKSTDEVEAEALKIWEGDENLRAEFGGEKSPFLAAFKRDPKNFRPKK